MAVNQLPYAIDENNPEYSLYLNKALYNFPMMVPDFVVLIHANLSIGRIVMFWRFTFLLPKLSGLNRIGNI
ncbi:hypothetical protein [Snodgrassella communis]|uniref:hypothetical protein n=1 Tax=Snodgrassella communis TaxID=2946699 RepID=UPI000CAFE718|nr:hypothetical protein [Snodgrassella communis]PIT20643.1 hypothetical protein BGI35_07165 [Snodgrassella communis]